MKNKQVRFGIIGLGMMGREFGSSVARWCNLTEDVPQPVITAICNRSDNSKRDWFLNNFPSISVVSNDYHDLLESDQVDAIYCAVPHNLHEQMYIDIIRSGKHLLGEKPFGIDKKANNNIMQVIRDHPDIIVRCVSQYPYYPGSKHIIDWAHEQRYGKIMEVRAGLLHSSDMDPNKKINWKRMLKYNGEYGCMGDLGFHVQHIPFRLGWMPHSVFAHLQNITTSRPDETGTQVPCETWDNALLCCQSTDTATDSTFPINFEVKRMSPGHTNTWYLEIDGTEESIAFSTRNPKALYHLKTTGKQQGWTRYDIGSDFFFPTITAGIFEAGQTDVIQQMIAAFMYEFSSEKPDNFFATATPEETVSSHAVFTAALESWEKGETILLE